MAKKIIFTALLLAFASVTNAQLKFIVEDFEGCADGTGDLKKNGLFTFGNTSAEIDSRILKNNPKKYKDYLGQRSLKVEQNTKVDFGGWGKGVGLNVELDRLTDHLNFYFLASDLNNKSTPETIKIELQEDDNGNSVYEKEADDSWTCIQTLNESGSLKETKKGGASEKGNWKLISVPLSKFADANPGGDGIFNISYTGGKLFCVVISFISSEGDTKIKKEKKEMYFDFICFSKGKLPVGTLESDPPEASQKDHCNLGAWSMEGNEANFTDIGLSFEKNFKECGGKRIGIVHFFQAFSFDGGKKENHGPSEERINKVINEGYIPMITLENHFVNLPASGMKQPNLYSIVEGHFDAFFGDWAKQLKQVKGTVILRILHEFNGNWYPWCIANNDKNPELLIKAFRHIRTIFKEKNVTNVKFIWCPNSMSIPQEKWNYIMDAYPGDEYADYIGMDIYNGSGDGPIWRSFRKEGISNYFTITQEIPDKPLFVCEVASRERKIGEFGPSQNKEEWIKQMSEALKSDMAKIRLLTWFNEKETFKINSSPGAREAFLDYIMKDEYFKSGTKFVLPLIR